MASPPKVLLFVACDAAVTDDETGKLIVGIHSRVQVPRFPAAATVVLCAKLTALNGDYEIHVEVWSTDLQAVLRRASLPEILGVADRFEEFVLTAPLDVEFERPGRHSVRLVYNGRIADDFTIHLVQRP